MQAVCVIRGFDCSRTRKQGETAKKGLDKTHFSHIKAYLTSPFLILRDPMERNPYK